MTIFNCERLAGKHAGVVGADHLVLGGGGGGGAGGGASFAAAALVCASTAGASEVAFGRCGVAAGRGIDVVGDGLDVVTVVDLPAEIRRVHKTFFRL